MIPEELRYTPEHEWVAAGEGGRLRVGITHFAQDALGDIVFIDLPDTGTDVAAGDTVGEVESTKSVSEIYAPVSGTVVAVNDQVSGSPEVINTDPYGDGWLLEITPTDPAAADALLDAEAYRKLTST